MAGEVTMEQLLEKMQGLQEQFSDLQKENGELKSQLAEVAGKQLEDKPEEALVVPTEPFDHKGKKYKVTVGGFYMPGKEGGDLITAQELMADSDLVDDVLKIKGQGILKEIV